MVVYPVTLGEKNTYFLSDHYKIIEKEKVEEKTLLKGNANSLHPFDYHVLKSGENMFTELRYEQTLSCCRHDDDEDICRAQKVLDDLHIAQEAE